MISLQSGPASRFLSNFIDPTFLNVKNYGAKGDGKYLPDGVTVNGSAVLSSASALFQQADVGKYISITGAGIAGQDLITTIATVRSSSTVTLGVAASTSVTGSYIHYASDDTTAIQLGINAVVSAGGGTLYFPWGMYGVAGALQTGNGYNTQLTLGTVKNYETYPLMAIRLLGSQPPTYNNPEMFIHPAPINTSMIFSFSAGGAGIPSIIGASRTPGGTFGFQALDITVENIRFRMSNNPQLTALDFEFSACAVVRHVAVDVPLEVYRETQPTNTEAVGIRFPGVNNSTNVIGDNLYVAGFYWGIQFNEHFYGTTINIEGCYKAVQVGQGGHTSIIDQLRMHQNPYEIVVAGTGHYVDFVEVSVERGGASGLPIEPAAWLAPVFDLVAGATCVGKMRFRSTTHAPGPSTTYGYMTVSGGDSYLIQTAHGAKGTETKATQKEMAGTVGWQGLGSVDLPGAGDYEVYASFGVYYAGLSIIGIVRTLFRLFDGTTEITDSQRAPVFVDRTQGAAASGDWPFYFTQRVRVLGPTTIFLQAQLVIDAGVIVNQQFVTFDGYGLSRYGWRIAAG